MPDPVLGPSSTFLESTKDTPPEQRKSRMRTGIALLAVMVLVTIAVGATMGRALLVPNAPSAAAPTQSEPLPAQATVKVHAGQPSQAAPVPAAPARPSTAPLAVANDTATPDTTAAPEKPGTAAPTVRRPPAPRRTASPREPNLGF
jgi:hypothetical protein